MNLDQYQRSAMTFRLPTADREYALLNLLAEAGEVAGKAAKHRRDGGDVQEYNTHMKKELGDVLWYAAVMADALGLTLARWLVGHGARELLLVGRSAPDAGARAVLDDLSMTLAGVAALNGETGGLQPG